MAFSEVLWQQRIVNILSKVIRNGRVANAYLFTGPVGIGKLHIAKLFAKSINCPEGSLFDECGCQTCSRIERGVYPDVVEIAPDGSKIKVDQIRTLKDITRYGPSRGKWLVVILNNTETFTTEAANSFLKLLEEPPSGVVFVLVSPNLSAHLPTIRSRCQILHFSQLSSGMVKQELQRNDCTNVDEIIDVVGGELALARLLSDENIPVQDIVRELDTVASSGVAAILKLAEEMSKQEKEDLGRLLDVYTLLLMHRLKNDSTTLEEKKNLRKGIRICFEMLKNISTNINVRLHLEAMMLTMNRRAA